MPYIHKAPYPFPFPAAGEVRELFPRKTYFPDSVSEGEIVYVFVENSATRRRDSHLVARGKILTARKAGSTWRLTVEFDGVAPKTPLPTHELGPYARLGSGSGTRGGVEHPERTDIAEIYRRTTMQPLHRIKTASATWLDQNHFEG